MRYLYLLAASLLTGFVIPASPLTHLSIIQSENYPSLWNFPENSLPHADEKSVANVNSLATEPETSIHFSDQPVVRTLATGRELYYQRLAALKAGQIYTRIPNIALQPLLASEHKRQLTYQDWKNLLAMEAKAMSQGQGTNRLGIITGDSLSLWFPKEKLPVGMLWLNQGISGDTSTGIFKRLSLFSATQPDVIFLMAGINDLRRGEKDELIIRNHRLIIRRLRRTHPKSEIIVQSILPTRLSTISNSRIRHINYQIAQIAKQEGATYLNLHNWFTDFQGDLREDLTTDGLHLSADGYEVWRLALLQVELQLAISRVTRSP